MAELFPHWEIGLTQRWRYWVLMGGLSIIMAGTAQSCESWQWQRLHTHISVKSGCVPVVEWRCTSVTPSKSYCTSCSGRLIGYCAIQWLFSWQPESLPPSLASLLFGSTQNSRKVSKLLSELFIVEGRWTAWLDEAPAACDYKALSYKVFRFK